MPEQKVGEHMTKGNLSKSWLELVGKEKLQAFQDIFARRHKVGVSFLDREGNPLTVASQSSLLCHNLKLKERLYCQTEHQSSRSIVVVTKEPEYFTCGVGVSYFLCPVIWCEEVVAFVEVGCYLREDNTLPEKYTEQYHVPVFTKEQAEDICSLLSGIIKLLNVDFKKLYNTGAKVELKEEVVFNDRRLSYRERQAVWLLCSGLNNREIGEQLMISEKTVKTHISNILKKLGRSNRLQIVLYYLQQSMNP